MFRQFFLAAILTSLSLHATADTVLLGNGDRITGAVMGIEDGRLLVETEYAGPLALALDAVSFVETEEARTIRLEDGALLEGRLVSTGEVQQILTDAGARQLSWGDVTTLAVDAAEVDAVEFARAEAVAAAEAQRIAAEASPKVWSGTIDAGATWRSGEVSTVDAILKVTGTRAWDDRKLLLTGEASYGEADSQVNVRRYFGQARYEQHLSERVFAYGMTNLEHDAARGLHLRWGTAAGLGYDFVQRENTKLSADMGLSYRVEWWNELTLSQERRARAAQQGVVLNETRALLEFLRTAPLLSDAGTTAVIRYANRVQAARVHNSVDRSDGAEIRLAARLEQNLWERGKLTNDLVILPDIEEWGEVRAINELGIATPLSESLALRITLKSEYDSTPGLGNASEWDHTLITGLRYSF